MDLSKRAHEKRAVRQFAFDDIELRAAEDGDTLTLVGEASVVEHPYVVRDMFGEFSETIRAGAFDKTLSEKPDVVFLVNHQGMPLARTSSGTLQLAASPHLSVRADLDPSDPDVTRVEKKMRRGDMNEMSFAFRVTKQTWNDDYTERDITEVSLHRGDVSVVTFGANPATVAALRALDIGGDEFADAFESLKRGDATPEQRAIVERAAVSLNEVLEESEPDEEPTVPDSVFEDYARLLDIDPLDPAA